MICFFKSRIAYIFSHRWRVLHGQHLIAVHFVLFLSAEATLEVLRPKHIFGRAFESALLV